MLYTITARVSNRPSGEYRFRTDVPTFYLHSATQGITCSQHAAAIAYRMLSHLVRQDLSAGAEIHGECVNEDGTDYAPLIPVSIV